jgi:hypothetical protein
MKKSIFQSIKAFFITEDPYQNEDTILPEKIATVQDAYVKLINLYSPKDLQRCKEISDILRTLQDAQSFNPLTPVKTLPAGKQYLLDKYL